MGFPEDIWRVIVTFMTTPTIQQYRIVDSVSCLLSQHHQPHDSIKGKLKYWNACFPHATKIILRYH